MKAMVTGGAGFVGHHLARALVERGDEVVVLDSLITGIRDRLGSSAHNISLIDGDVRDRSAVAASVEGVDTVFHLAALASVQGSIEDPGLTNEINVVGTINVMEAAAAAAVRRVVLAGSSAVYGSSPDLPLRESHRPDPQSPYAVSKLAAEGYALTIGAVRGIESVVLRYFNVFGPGQDPDSPYAAVVPKFITAAMTGQRPTVNGDGSQSRDFTFVDDVVRANLLGAEVPDASGRIFNVGCGASYSLLQLLAEIGRITGTELDPEFGPTLPGDVRDSLADISLARDVLGYTPLVDFSTGMERTVAAFSEGQSART